MAEASAGAAGVMSAFQAEHSPTMALGAVDLVAGSTAAEASTVGAVDFMGAEGSTVAADFTAAVAATEAAMADTGNSSGFSA
jgi:hypothetical protein